MQSYLECISNVPNLFIPGAKLTTRKTQETSFDVPITSPLYRDSILIMHIIPPFCWLHPKCWWFYDLNPSLPLHRRNGPRMGGPEWGGACPWCCTASGNSPWSSPQSANHERCQMLPEISTTPNDWSIIFLENHRFWRIIDSLIPKWDLSGNTHEYIH